MLKSLDEAKKSFVEPEDFEDLIWPTLYAPQARIGFMRDSAPGKNQWPGVALVSSVINPGLQLVRANSGQKLSSLWEWAAQQPALALRKPPLQDSVPTLNSDHSN